MTRTGWLPVLLLSAVVGCGSPATAARADGSAHPDAAAHPVAASEPKAAATQAPPPTLSVADAFLAQGGTRGVSDGGHFELLWRADGGAIPRNEPCALSVLVLRDGRPCADVRVVVRGWMPDHGHGLIRAPQVTDQGDGRYRVDSLLLHMRGQWQLLFDLSQGNTVDVARFELSL